MVSYGHDNYYQINKGLKWEHDQRYQLEIAMVQ